MARRTTESCRRKPVQKPLRNTHLMGGTCCRLRATAGAWRWLPNKDARAGWACVPGNNNTGGKGAVTVGPSCRRQERPASQGPQATNYEGAGPTHVARATRCEVPILQRCVVFMRREEGDVGAGFSTAPQSLSPYIACLRQSLMRCRRCHVSQASPLAPTVTCVPPSPRPAVSQARPQAKGALHAEFPYLQVLGSGPVLRSWRQLQKRRGRTHR